MNPKNSPTPELIELSIDRLSYNGGRGVGRVDGRVVFVPGTAPGDFVRARVVRRKAKYSEAKLIEVLKPSPERREAPCPVAARCGGCSWQHVRYEEQVRQKDAILRHALAKFAVRWHPFLKAPREFEYRNRIQLQVAGARWGFFAAGSNDLVEFDRCYIAEPALNAEKARRNPRDFINEKKVEIALLAEGTTRVMTGPRDPEAALFGQVNTLQNQNLKALVRAAIHPGAVWFMDLYSGDGNFTGELSAGVPGARGLAVELSQAAVARGRQAHPHVEWIAGDVAKILAKTPRPAGPGVILLDPPRVGCEADVIERLRALAPDQILFVSCNPATFARDAERLLGDGSYVFEFVRGIDMFPQTAHVELIASLRRR